MKYILGNRLLWSWVNKNKEYKRESRIPMHGRAALYRAVPQDERYHSHWHPSVHLEWHLLSRMCHLSFEFGGEDDFQLSLAIPFVVSFWLSFDSWLSSHFRKRYAWMNQTWPMEIEVSIHHSALWWTIWRNEMEGWSSSTPRWRQGSFHFDDFFLGRPKHSEETLYEIKDTFIDLGDGAWPVSIRLFESTWKRPRWFAKKMLRAEIEALNPEGIPTGEEKFGSANNTYSTTLPARSVKEAIEKFAASIEKERRQHSYYQDYA